MTNPISGEELLRMFAIPFENKGHELNACCPFHEDKSPSFYMEKSSTVYYCFGCGAKGNWYTFIKNFTGENPFKYLGIKVNEEDLKNFLRDKAFNTVLQQKKEVKKKLEIPKLKIIANQIHPFQDEQSKDYCTSRFITEKDIQDFGIFYIEDGYIGMTRFKKRLVIPVHDFEGNILSYEGRDITRQDEKKCLYPFGSKIGYSIFDYSNLEYEKPLILVEGIMDVLKVRKVIKQINPDFQISSAFGIELTSFQKEILKKFNRIISFLDPDKGGERGIENLKSFLEPTQLEIADSRKLLNDPGESSEEEIVYALSNKMSLAEYSLFQNDLLQPDIFEW